MRADLRWMLTLLAGCALLAAVVTVADGGGLPEWVFVTICLAALALTVTYAVDEWRAAAVQRRRARLLATTPVDDVARRAVAEERARLAEDIGVELRRSLGEVEREVAALDRSWPTASLQRIHRHAREASTELRRHLGLLRQEEEIAEAEATDRAETAAELEAATEAARALPSRGDVGLAVAVVALALVESLLYPGQEGYESSTLAVVLVCASAATLIGARTQPGASAIVVGSVYVLATSLELQLTSGFWVIPTFGGLMWVLARRGRTLVDVAGAVTLVLGVVLEYAALDPDNLPVTVAVLAVAAAGGLAARVFAHLRTRADDAAEAHHTQLEEASRDAVNAERASYAREIHDVVSHAVGLVAVQAAAAEVSWPDDPDATWQAVDIIATTVATATAELDRLQPDALPHERTIDDVDDLVARIRAAGTPVEVEGVVLLVLVDLPTAYRVIQEALTNVVRHAGSATATVTCRATALGVTISISDDGPGGSVERGHGLVGLSERVAFAGGTLTTYSDRGSGFLVEAVLPAVAEVVQ